MDIRTRWRAGTVFLVLAGLLTLVALWRPLAPQASPRLRFAVTLLLGLGVAGSALLAGLKGRGRAERLAFYVFLVLSLDGLGQILAPLGWPPWPLFALVVCALAIAEDAAVAYGAAGLLSLLGAADAARGNSVDGRPALAAAVGYVSLVAALKWAQRYERDQLRKAEAEIDRLRFGLDEPEPAPDESTSASGTRRLLRRVSEQGRRELKIERKAELEQLLLRLTQVAKTAINAHAVLYFDVDREREVARLLASSGPETLKPDASVPLRQDPFGFVLERRVPFYATDFKRLLHELPYYKAGVKIGTLLALPVVMGEVVQGVLVADRLEIQAFTGEEPQALEGFAALAADAVVQTRAAMGREEEGLEFQAVYRVSDLLARATDGIRVRKILLDNARKLVAVEGAAFVMTDESQTRYEVVEAHGWAQPFEGRDVGLMERTFAAWVLRGEESLLIDDLSAHHERMPILVLDEDQTGAESLLIVPLRVGQGDEPDDEAEAEVEPLAGQRLRLIGALIMTGRRSAFDATARRVLGLFANQAAATLHHIQLTEREKSNAQRDGLTGLYNRRAFDDQLRRTCADEDRRPNGRFTLLLLDIDHFKKLNDTYGHPAGDAALRNTARTIQKTIRKADVAARYGRNANVAARYGGEEFVVIMPSADEVGAYKVAERLRRAIEKEQVIFEAARITLTASIGLAEWPAQGKEPEALLASADRALYAAKEAGRNRVCLASALAPLPVEASAAAAKDAAR